MSIRNKSGPIIEPCGTPALILAQDKLWPLKITLKKSVKRLNKFPEISPLHLSL